MPHKQHAWICLNVSIVFIGLFVQGIFMVLIILFRALILVFRSFSLTDTIHDFQRDKRPDIIFKFLHYGHTNTQSRTRTVRSESIGWIRIGFRFLLYVYVFIADGNRWVIGVFALLYISRSFYRTFFRLFCISFPFHWFINSPSRCWIRYLVFLFCCMYLYLEYRYRFIA